MKGRFCISVSSFHSAPNRLLISELCIFGFSTAILRRCPRLHTMKAFWKISRVTYGNFFGEANKDLEIYHRPLDVRRIVIDGSVRRLMALRRKGRHFPVNFLCNLKDFYSFEKFQDSNTLNLSKNSPPIASSELALDTFLFPYRVW